MLPSLNNVRLRDKMLILYFTSVFIPIVLTNVIFYQVTTHNVKEQRMQDLSRAIEQVKSEFTNEVENAVSVSTVFYTDLILNDILEAEYEDASDYVLAYDSYLRRILNSYGPVYYSLQGITVYVDNPTMLYSGGIDIISDEVKQTPWYQLLQQEGRNAQPIFIQTVQPDQSVTFSIVRVLNYYYPQNEREKILKIDLKTSEIEQIFSNLNVQGDMYLLNAEDEVMWTTNEQLEWVAERMNYSALPKSSHTIQFESSPIVPNYLDSWRVIGTVSDAEVFEQVQKSRSFILYLAAINVVVPTLIILWITQNLNVRLVRILKHMKKVKNQMFDTIQGAETRDEIGQLSGEFNRMTLQIKSLIDDVYVADIQRKDLEIQRRDSQLHALQSQINPHFLFNALETIRMRSLMKHEAETAKIIHNMAKLFRSSLTWGKDKIRIMEELEFIRCFLEIQQYRFGDRLEYEIHVDQAAKECVIPKMLFLPFVENASIHGIEKTEWGGRIDISITCDEAGLHFSIRDNGVGMRPEQVARIYSYLELEEELGDHIGVQNVIYRLKMIYGERFRFCLDSKPGQGTNIGITIPMDGDV